MLYWGPVTTGVKNLIRSRIKELFDIKRLIISVFNGTIRVHRENGLSRQLDRIFRAISEALQKGVYLHLPLKSKTAINQKGRNTKAIYTLQRIFSCYPVQYEHLYCGYVTLHYKSKRNIRWFVLPARTSLLSVTTNLRQTVHPSLSGIFLLPHYLPPRGWGGGYPAQWPIGGSA